MNGPAQDQTKREAEDKSRHCPYCRGAGLVPVFHPAYDTHRTLMREVIYFGEIVTRPIQAIVAAHCLCPMGEWIRVRTDPDILHRIPLLADVLSGRSRWLAQDPTRDEQGEYREKSPRRAVAELAESMKAR
jgi:hypothetical protein